MEISDAEIANWADQIRRERRNTAPWHYVDIPIGAERFDETRDGDHGNNVIRQIEKFEKVLADRTAPKEDRAEALKFIVHFVGDLHQPLHCADRNGDRGGNGRLVFYLDQPKAMALHRVWDTTLLRSYVGRTKIADYADKLDKSIGADRAAEWHKGTPEDWANESHVVAREHVYKDIPADGPPPKIDQAYIDANRAVVEQQLERGGIRLAALLNRCFDVSAGAPSSRPLSNPNN